MRLVGPRLAAVLGVLAISFAGVFARASGSSPATVAFFRGVYALPVLVFLAWIARSRDQRTARERFRAALAGCFFAVDLSMWHQSIHDLGVGLGTVLPNVQVVFVGALAWVLHGERPTLSAKIVLPFVIVGVALISGLGGAGSFGVAPVRGVVLGLGCAAAYTGFLMIFRSAQRPGVPVYGPLRDATASLAATALLLGVVFDPGLDLAPRLPAHGFLVALGLGCQVGGWLLIGSALPRLPALDTSVLLLVQPCAALVWGRLLFDEQPSAVQLVGALSILVGVAVLGRGAAAPQSAPGASVPLASGGASLPAPSVEESKI